MLQNLAGSARVELPRSDEIWLGQVAWGMIASWIHQGTEQMLAQGISSPCFWMLFLSKCLHSLVQLSLPPSTSETDVSATEEAWGYLEDALSILSSTVSGTGK